MIKYHIRVNNGDDNKTVQYHFVHEDWMNISQQDSDIAFDKAVKELDHIYQTYGRFATEVGVARLFKSFGFDRVIKD